VLQTALCFQPNFADVCNNLASIYAQLGDVYRAIEWYTAALQINPNLADVHQNLGDLLLSQGPTGATRAQEHFQKVLKADPKYSRAWRGLGDAMRELGEHEKAIPFYLEVCPTCDLFMQALLHT
jgi:Tfp pilus assembly protein PilF